MKRIAHGELLILHFNDLHTFGNHDQNQIDAKDQLI